MKFKQFYTEAELQDDLYAGLSQFCLTKPQFPKPTAFLGSGGRGDEGGFVWNTTNPGMVVRIGAEETNDCEVTIADEEIQETGGVVKVYYQASIPIGGRPFHAAWKEKVDENVEGFLRRNYKDKFEEVGYVLAALYHVDRDGLRILNSFPPTQGLYRAIMRGLPVSDLALEQNLGVTKDGRIVAFDC